MTHLFLLLLLSATLRAYCTHDQGFDFWIFSDPREIKRVEPTDILEADGISAPFQEELDAFKL